MDIGEAKLNLKVKHQKFGTGIITGFDQYITVKFDKEFEDKSIRTMRADVLEIIGDNELTNKENVNINVHENSKFQKGDIVVHSFYGQGIIIEKRGYFKSLVKFQVQSSPILILNDKLTKIEGNIIDDDEVVDLNIESRFKIVPSNYSEQSCYSTSAKRLMNYFRKRYPDEGIATIKSYKESDGETGVLIVPSKGVIVFKMFDNEFPDELFSSPFFEGSA